MNYTHGLVMASPCDLMNEARLVRTRNEKPAQTSRATIHMPLRESIEDCVHSNNRFQSSVDYYRVSIFGLHLLLKTVPGYACESVKSFSKAVLARVCRDCLKPSSTPSNK